MMNLRFSAVGQMATSLAVLALLAMSVSAARAADEEKEEKEKIDIAGQYACRGGNPGGATYTGKVVITKTGETYRLNWTIGNSQSHVGVGILEGNVLAVCFASQQSAGVVAYKVEKTKDGPRLTGRWAGLGGDKTQTETLTKGPLPAEKPLPGRPRITQLEPEQSGRETQGQPTNALPI